MRTTAKFLGIGAAAVAATLLAATSHAQQGPGGPGMMRGMGHGMMMGHGPMMGGGMMGGMGGMMTDGFADPAKRLEAIKADLALKPEQTTAWEAYAKVVTDTAAEHKTMREGIDRDAVSKMEPKERQSFMEAMSKQRQASQEKVKAAAEALLAKLDDAQKTKANRSLPGLAFAGPGAMAQHGMGPGMGMMMHGMGPGMWQGQATSPGAAPQGSGATDHSGHGTAPATPPKR